MGKSSYDWGVRKHPLIPPNSPRYQRVMPPRSHSPRRLQSHREDPARRFRPTISIPRSTLSKLVAHSHRKLPRKACPIQSPAPHSDSRSEQNLRLPLVEPAADASSRKSVSKTTALLHCRWQAVARHSDAVRPKRHNASSENAWDKSPPVVRVPPSKKATSISPFGA